MFCEVSQSPEMKYTQKKDKIISYTHTHTHVEKERMKTTANDLNSFNSKWKVKQSRHKVAIDHCGNKGMKRA